MDTSTHTGSGDTAPIASTLQVGLGLTMATFPMLRDRVDRFKLRSYMLLDLVEAQATSEVVVKRIAEIRRQIAAIIDWPPPASVRTNVAILTMSECLDSLITEACAAGDV